MNELTDSEKKMIVYALLWSCSQCEEKDIEITFNATEIICRKIEATKQLYDLARNVTRMRRYLSDLS